RMGRCRVWIYAPGAALAFVRALPRHVVGEAVVVAVAVSHNPEPARRPLRNQLRIRKRPSPRRQPLPALAALAQTSRPLQTWCRRPRRESSIAFTGTRRLSSRRTIRASFTLAAIGSSNLSIAAIPGPRRLI